MLNMKPTIDGAGRVVVPKTQRKGPALAAGSGVEIELVGDGLLLRPTAAASPIVAEDGFLVHRGDKAVAIDAGTFIREIRAVRTAASRHG